ncbi:MAG: hypothetical protein ACK5PD_16545, partial [Pirellulaceae bacterium]
KGSRPPPFRYASASRASMATVGNDFLRPDSAIAGGDHQPNAEPSVGTEPSKGTEPSEGSG